MSDQDALQSFKSYLESLSSGSVPINTAFKLEIANALANYAYDKGLNKPQDVIRLACAGFLTKAGYLKNNS
jgi:hypothetical protein